MQNNRSCCEVAPLGNLTYKCNLHGSNTANQRIRHKFNRTGNLHVRWETLQVFVTLLFCMSLILNTVQLSRQSIRGTLTVHPSRMFGFVSKFLNSAFFYFLFFSRSAHYPGKVCKTLLPNSKFPGRSHHEMKKKGRNSISNLLSLWPSGFFVWKVQATAYCLYFEAEGRRGNMHNFF
jgi:hypothetical protein